MSTEYKIEAVGGIVDRYPTEDAARQDIERCKRQDSTADNAHFLVENAVMALMKLNDIDRDTAERAIRDVMGG